MLKVGILTYHRAHNFGAYLQGYALCSRLNEEEGIDAELIDFRMKKEVDFYVPNRNRNIIKKLLIPGKTRFNKVLAATFNNVQDGVMKLSKEKMVSDSQEDFVKFVKGKYDVIVAGSDEIWKTDGYRGFPTPYWLGGKLDCVKMTYAASSRSDFSILSDEKRAMLRELVNDFYYIGIREQITIDRLGDYLEDKTKLHLCCDPSFIYDFNVPQKSINDILNGRAHVDENKKTILLMTNKKNLAKKIVSEFKKDFNIVSVFQYNEGCINVPDINPMEWLMLIKNTDLMLTTYFHGTAFSIINETPFVSFGSIHRSSKIASLFEGEKELGFHYIEDTEGILTDPNFKKKVLERMKPVDSKEYLRKLRAEFENSFIAQISRLKSE